MLTRHWFFVISLVLTLLASACGEAGFGVAQAGLSAPASVPIDPVFKEFYQTLGGEALLGRGISTLVDRNGDQCQFVEAALMCFDQSEAESSKRYRLEPLGYQLQVSDDPRLPPPPDAGTRVLGDGFVLYREFETVYDRIYGDLYAGLPLTQVRINRDAQRYEQFFENVGFYRRFSDPPDAVHLLPYGGYFCGLGCSNHQGDFWQIVRSGQISQPFEMTLLRMGWNDLGRPVSQPRQPGDGTIEQVYESAVLYAPLDNISQIRMRPLVLWMGQVVVQPPVERNPHEQLVFYETENGLGHNVPFFFDRFIALHGGREISGKPITEFFPEEDGTHCQCFENFCLSYDPTRPEDQRVKASPLGEKYALDAGLYALRRFTPDLLELRLDEGLPEVHRGEVQILSIQVVDRTSGAPMSNVGAWVTLSGAGRQLATLNFAPTNVDGRAMLELAPFTDLPAMSVVEYQVCLDLPDDPKLCAVDSFVFSD